MTFEKCLRCGLCQVGCPLFQTTREEAQSAKGRNLFFQLGNPLSEIHQSIWSCTLCGYCDKICVRDIGNRDQVKNWRKMLIGLNYTPDKVLEIRNKVLNLYSFLPNSVPGKEISSPIKKNSSNRLLYLGCFAKIGESLVPKFVTSRLTKWRIEFDQLEDEKCCGNPLFEFGFEDEFKEHQKKLISRLAHYKEIIVICADCGENMVRLSKASNLNFLVRNFFDIYFQNAPPPKSTSETFFHFPCKMLHRNFSKYHEAFKVIRGVSPSNIDSVGYSLCCGGMNPQFHSSQKADMIEFIIKRRHETRHVITYCPGCYENYKKFVQNRPLVDQIKFDVHFYDFGEPA